MTIINRRNLLATLATGAAVAAATALPASGQDPAATRTLTLKSVQGAHADKLIDVRPRGESVGDRYVLSTDLRRGGRLAGRMEVDCLLIDRRYGGQMCSATAILADGTITVHGGGLEQRLPGQAAQDGDVLAVTGGTGAYAGVRGTMRRTGNGRADTLVFELG
jgi:hypothetical protein